MTRLDKFPLIGGYVKVIGRIARESISPFIVILILLCGFLIAFKNRSAYKGQGNTSSFDTMKNFNRTFEFNVYQMYAMMIGNFNIDGMGVDTFTGPNLLNFGILFLFMFLITSLAFNIFTGIAINEINTLIEDSNIQIMRDKINYIYEDSLSIGKCFDQSPTFTSLRKKFFEIVTKVYKIKWLKERAIHNCTKFRNWLFACFYKEEPEEMKPDVNDSEQMDFVDDKYIEHFEMLQYSAKNLEERTKSLELKLDLQEDKLKKILNILSSGGPEGVIRGGISYQ